MVYDVTYQVGGEERTDRVVAPHAAGAAARVEAGYDDGGELYELLRVQMLAETDGAAAD